MPLTLHLGDILLYRDLHSLLHIARHDIARDDVEENLKRHEKTSPQRQHLGFAFRLLKRPSALVLQSNAVQRTAVDKPLRSGWLWVKQFPHPSWVQSEQQNNWMHCTSWTLYLDTTPWILEPDSFYNPKSKDKVYIYIHAGDIATLRKKQKIFRKSKKLLHSLWKSHICQNYNSFRIIFSTSPRQLDWL